MHLFLHQLTHNMTRLFIDLPVQYMKTTSSDPIVYINCFWCYIKVQLLILGRPQKFEKNLTLCFDVMYLVISKKGGRCFQILWPYLNFTITSLFWQFIFALYYFCTILFLHYFLCTYLFLSTSGVRDRFFFVVPTSELSIFPLLVKLSMTSSIILYAKINQL